MTSQYGSDTKASDNARGYVRAPELQARFDQAAATLLDSDGWVDPQGQKKLVADMALEGGGVKGIALVGAVLALDEAGYSFARVAGTSAGAIVATVIAALTKGLRPGGRESRFSINPIIAHLTKAWSRSAGRWRKGSDGPVPQNAGNAPIAPPSKMMW